MNFFSKAKREVTQITEGHAIAELSKPLGVDCKQLPHIFGCTMSRNKSMV